MDDVEVGECRRFEQEFHSFMDTNYSGVLARLVEKKAFDDALKAEMIAAIKAFKERFAATAKK
jgi:F0F1-type ATP synthase alpha subunit